MIEQHSTKLQPCSKQHKLLIGNSASAMPEIAHDRKDLIRDARHHRLLITEKTPVTSETKHARDGEDFSVFTNSTNW